MRRNTAFLAFTFADHDWNPGDATGNGEKTWSDETGCAGTVGVPGDTGWIGDIARSRKFVCRQGEKVRWEFGGEAGDAEACDDGALSIPMLAWGVSPIERVLSR